MAGMSTLPTKEFAFLEVAIPNTFRCNFGNGKLEKYFIKENKWVYFLGKGTRSIDYSEPKSEDKIKLFEKKYDEYKMEAERIIKNYCG